MVDSFKVVKKQWNGVMINLIVERERFHLCLDSEDQDRDKDKDPQ